MALEKFNFSDDFQDQVLACTIRYPERFDLHSELLQPEFFNGVTAVEVVFRIKEYYKKYSAWPNFITLGNFVFNKHQRLNPDKARECAEYVQKIALADTKDKDAIFDMVVAFAQERATYRAMRVVQAAAMEGKEIEGGIVSLFEKAVNIGKNNEDMGVLLKRDIDELIDGYATTERGIGTGFAPLNSLWKVGWPKGWLIVPLAPPKTFKTTFCINLALNMASSELNGDVLYYACEIGQKLAALRALCNIAGYTMDNLYDAKEHFRIAAHESVEQYTGNILFKGYASKTVTIGQIKSHAKRAIKLYDLKPRAIFIDYAETVRPDIISKDASDWRQQADVYVQARALGDELGCCVIMPDRCKIEFADRPVPSARAFQGAFEKAGIVDIGIGICQTQAEKLINRVRYFVFLNRHGRSCAHYEGVIDPERYRMTLTKEIEYTPEEEETEFYSKGQKPPRGRRKASRVTPEMKAMDKCLGEEVDKPE